MSKFETIHDKSDPVLGACRKSFPVTPHNTNPLSTIAWRGIYVGVGGDLTVRTLDGDADVTYKMDDKSYLSVVVTHVRATGTTASALVGEA